MSYDYNEIVFPKLGIDIHVNSTAFSIFGFDIQWYGILIATGVLLAFLFAFKNFKIVGLDSNKTFDVIIAGLVGGIIGARAYYVIMEWDQYKDDILSIFNTRQGGLAFYGGLIGAVLFGFIMAKIRKVKLLPLLDIVGIGFLIGQTIGRWGNFFNQEAFGSNTDSVFGMTGGRIQSWISENVPSMDPEMPVHPCFLYESVWCFIGIILLSIVFYKARKFDGQIFIMYIGWYGLGRAFIESLRSDSLYIGTIKVSQALAILCVIASVITLIIMLNYVKRMGSDYVLYKDTEESKELLAKAEKNVFVQVEKDDEKGISEKTDLSEKSAESDDNKKE